jgi:hypothetical protein|tara:strand:- start:3070 stop:3678 length:609 start_codon:yes stop_codon:yes gene_type:complete
MSSVIADGEEVVFDGDVPTNPNHVYDLLMGALSENGRAVVKFIVDGVDTVASGESPSTYEKIEVISLSHDELTLRLIIESMNHLSSAEKEFEAYIRNILSIAWSDVFQRMNEFINKVQPFADLLDNLSPYAQTYNPPWKDALEKVTSDQAVSLGEILTAFQQGNPSSLSDELSINFLPVFKRARKLFAENIIPFLQEKVKAA